MLYLDSVAQVPRDSQGSKDHVREKLPVDIGETLAIAVCIECTYTLHNLLLE